MPRLRTSLLTAGAGLAAVALTGLSLAGPAAAAANRLDTTTGAVPAAAGWLTTQFVGAGHVPAPSGDHFDSKYGSAYYPNYGENADVVFGLAAAKSGGAKITTALRYLSDNADAYADFSQSQGGPYDGSVAKLAVADIVAAGDPTSFAGHNLLQTLKDDECTSAQTCTVGSAANIYASISESFTILAESRAGGAYAPSTAAVSYFLSLQCTSGGFTSGTSGCAAGDADVDATSYAIMALEALGGHGTQLDSAVAWLEGQRNSAGYWVSQGIANTNSTGLATAALQGAGQDVATSRRWLRSQQVPRGQAGAGALKYDGTVTPTTTDATSPSVLATAQGLAGLVDGGGLATLTAAGTTSSAQVFAPTTSLSTQAPRPGSRITVVSHGFAAGEEVEISVHSTTVVVASPHADTLGSVRSTFALPASLTSGAHTIELAGQTSGLVTDSPLTVTSTAGSSTPGATTPVTSAGGAAPLAATGQDGRQLLELAILGSLACITGLGLTFAGRARRHP